MKRTCENVLMYILEVWLTFSFLKSWSPISVIKILSIQILPSGSIPKEGSNERIFPAPVLPTMPTCEEIQEGLRTNNMQQTWETSVKMNFKSSILNIVYIFQPWHYWHFCLNTSLLWGGGCPVYCRMVSNSHGLYPLEARSTPKLSTKMSDIDKCLLVEIPWSKEELK